MSNIWMSKHITLRKTVGFIAVFAFCFNIVLRDAWATVEVKGPVYNFSPRTGGRFAPFDVRSFTVPADLGTIKDVYTGSNDKTVIHIQDAHCNYAAQCTIAKLIDYCNREYGINTVNLEGGKGSYDLSPFTNIYDREIRKKVADYFVREGVINAAEYFASNNPGRIKLWGIENEKLYFENLNIYRESLKHKDEIGRSLKSLEQILNNLKRHIYSKELLELDMKYAAYKAGNVDFKDYLTFLIQRSEKEEINIKPFTNLCLLEQSLGMEGRIDFTEANNERDELIDRLQGILSKKELEELVLKTVRFRQNKISPKEFYTYLSQKAKVLNPGLGAFPELQKYVNYIFTYEAVDRSQVIKEMVVLEDKLKETFYENDKQRRLNLLSKNFALLKNIFNVTLTREDYDYYRENIDAFAARNYVSFISKEAPLYGIAAKLDEHIGGLDGYRRKMARFYECSFKRDRAFLKNIRFGDQTAGIIESHSARERQATGATTVIPAEARIYKPEVTILVTGGFHSENLNKLFRRRGISYITIMPEFKNDDSYESPYFRLLSGEMSPLMRMINASMSGLAMINVLSEMGVSVPELRRFVRDGAAKLAKIEKGEQITIPSKEGHVILAKDRPEGKGKVTEVSYSGFTVYVFQPDDSAISGESAQTGAERKKGLPESRGDKFLNALKSIGLILAFLTLIGGFIYFLYWYSSEWHKAGIPGRGAGVFVQSEKQGVEGFLAVIKRIKPEATDIEHLRMYAEIERALRAGKDFVVSVEDGAVVFSPRRPTASSSTTVTVIKCNIPRDQGPGFTARGSEYIFKVYVYAIPDGEKITDIESDIIVKASERYYSVMDNTGRWVFDRRRGVIYYSDKANMIPLASDSLAEIEGVEEFSPDDEGYEDKYWEMLFKLNAAVKRSPSPGLSEVRDNFQGEADYSMNGKMYKVPGTDTESGIIVKASERYYSVMDNTGRWVFDRRRGVIYYSDKVNMVPLASDSLAEIEGVEEFSPDDEGYEDKYWEMLFKLNAAVKRSPSPGLSEVRDNFQGEADYSMNGKMYKVPGVGIGFNESSLNERLWDSSSVSGEGAFLRDHTGLVMRILPSHDAETRFDGLKQLQKLIENDSDTEVEVVLGYLDEYGLNYIRSPRIRIEGVKIFGELYKKKKITEDTLIRYLRPMLKDMNSDVVNATKQVLAEAGLEYLWAEPQIPISSKGTFLRDHTGLVMRILPSHDAETRFDGLKQLQKLIENDSDTEVEVVLGYLDEYGLNYIRSPRIRIEGVKIFGELYKKKKITEDTLIRYLRPMLKDMNSDVVNATKQVLAEAGLEYLFAEPQIPRAVPNPFRFPKYIWDRFDSRLLRLVEQGKLQQSSYQKVRMLGLSWTTPEGEKQRINDVLSEKEAKIVWTEAMMALRDAGAKNVESIHDVRYVVDYHENIHELLRKNDYEWYRKAIMPLFIQRLVKKFDIYGEGAPFIRALKKVYGEPCDEEKVPEDIARNTMLVWYLEEFFTLSIQEAVLFDDGGKVVDRMAATGEITNAGEIKDFVNSVLEEPEMQKFLNQLYAETLYDSLKELIPDMCDLMRRNVKTYAIEPDASRDYRDLEEAYLVKTERRLRNKRAHPGHARSYLADENWVENVKRTFEKMSEAFYADVTAEGIYATNPTRMVIRLLSPDGKDVEEEKDKIRKFIADRLRTLVSKDRRFSSDTRDSVVSTIVDRKIKFVTAYVEDMKYLNTVPDLFMDITMMELDRYEEGADGYGDEDTPPEGLVRRFLHLLKLSTNNFLEIKAAIENDGNELNIANILKKIFGGFVLRIRPIDWKELSVWKKSQDEILHAL